MGRFANERHGFILPRVYAFQNQLQPNRDFPLILTGGTEVAASQHSTFPIQITRTVEVLTAATESHPQAIARFSQGTFHGDAYSTTVQYLAARDALDP